MKAINLILTVALILIGGISYAQNTVSGTVSFDGNPLKGVIVHTSNNENGVRTNENGSYLINVAHASDSLIFVFPGMTEVKKAIKNKQHIDVAMEKITEETEEEADMVYCNTKALKVFEISSCAATAGGGIMAIPEVEQEFNTEEYSAIAENGFKNIATSPLSTFSIDVDRASYANIRRFLNQGQLPPAGSVRVEEMLNYFKYELNMPTGDNPIAYTTELSVCPWNTEHNLLFVGMSSKEIEKENLPPSNLVFLIDVSGSMNSANKLPLVKSSLKMLVNEMSPQDKIAIVTYAGAAKVALESTPGSNKKKINTAIDNLQAGGSTAGSKGLELAYQTASENFMEEGNNRIILASDGDFNIGQTSEAELENIVKLQSANNIFMTVLGFGMGNYKDNKLETIADKGNGNYAYIDNAQEAHKIFIQEFGGTLFTVAKDVKVQIEFNPEVVKSYRLIGYENRVLNNEDFNNDKKDAGDLGAGHQVVALYEIVPTTSFESTANVDALKYQNNKSTGNKKELATIKFRYKEPKANTSKKEEIVIENKVVSQEKASDNMHFAAAIAEFGMLLKNSEYKQNSSVLGIKELVKNINNDNDYGYKGEFIQLVEIYNSLVDSAKNR